MPFKNKSEIISIIKRATIESVLQKLEQILISAYLKKENKLKFLISIKQL